MTRYDEDYFKYEEKTELPEEINFNKLKKCPHCGKPIPEDATMCLYCGKETETYGRKKRWIIWIAILVLICFIALLIL